MENSAGAGGTIGRSIDELAALVDALDRHPRLGICLDSCHLYASGYDVTDPAVVDELVARGRRHDRPRPPARAPRERQRDAARLEPRPPCQHPRGRDRARASAPSSRHPAFQGLPAPTSRWPATGSGPDADELRKLRELHARWTKPRRAEPS